MIQDGPATDGYLGVALVLAGAAVVVEQIVTAAILHKVVPVLMAVAVALVGVALLRRAAHRTWVIDQTARVARFTIRRRRQVDAAEYPLGNIRDVVLEPDSDGGIRDIVFLMRDGTEVPWGIPATAARREVIACAEEARRLGGWPGADHPAETDSAPGARSVRPGPEFRIPPLVKSFAWIGLATLVFVAGGVVMLGTNLYGVLTWEPTPATVLSSGITARRDSADTYYTPDVAYTYSFDGASHTSHEVLPVHTSSSRDWAQEIASKFRPGQQVTAWVNPNEPREAFLVRSVGGWSLLFVGFAATMMIVVVIAAACLAVFALREGMRLSSAASERGLRIVRRNARP